MAKIGKRMKWLLEFIRERPGSGRYTLWVNSNWSNRDVVDSLYKLMDLRLIQRSRKGGHFISGYHRGQVMYFMDTTMDVHNNFPPIEEMGEEWIACDLCGWNISQSGFDPFEMASVKICLACLPFGLATSISAGSARLKEIV